ncbi:histidine kinase [Natrialba magadii ATCC 43099]|uniref:histidine kinase n=1 Tax=Natrialba magadii (strain ATCC 43099 / DSM 3394 / CCM 3739 / CIP 104546 / IAM 13178 / JCM 8861 / NBRC 102185 / NCIMB 2190 / MS3) TaxID=547559 RepID=D3SXY3_NATMM|nr:ATP-binding protein [Natrialba magadii]ADD04023.1 histidine kinase [Natrialba magadii ATCC 43099]ELY33180.1 integral membrane sensor signal transduction histidine kinase [Natrialba magadii ATCC 43099]
MIRQSRYIYLLGVLFLLIAAGQSLLKVVRGGAVLEAGIDFVLIGFAGVLFLSLGRWLSRSEFDPETYPRIVGWCLAGIAVMFVFLVLRAVHPGVAGSFTFGERALALALGSIAGLGIGIHDAQARTRQREVQRRNGELFAIQQELEKRNDALVETREELRRTVRQLEASNEQLDHFASTVSHDLQEPLRMISRYLQLLEERYGDELDEDATDFIDYAVDGADRMQAMVTGLLEYSKIDTQANGGQFERVDVEQTLQDVRTDLQVRIDESDAEITTESLPQVYANPSQLRQLFQNLLSNAIEYSGDEPPRVHVSAAPSETGTEWEFTVRDEGIGIEPSAQDRIFELFQRLHALDDHSGSGIGLALCQRIVEHHGGELWVESEPGVGSVFSFTLPASQPAVDQTQRDRLLE